jgi:addiction module HigA family antidote
MSISLTRTAGANEGRRTPPATGADAMAYKAGPKNTPPDHPGPIIAGTLEDCGVSIRSAAAAIGVSVNGLAKVLSAKGPLTPDMAARLGKYLGNGGRIWLEMQNDYDLSEAMRRLRPELAKIKPLQEK